LKTSFKKYVKRGQQIFFFQTLIIWIHVNAVNVKDRFSGEKRERERERERELNIGKKEKEKE